MRYSYSYTPQESDYLDELLSSTTEDDGYEYTPVTEESDEEPDEDEELINDLLGTYTPKRNSYRDIEPDSYGYTGDIQRTIHKESGGNPYAVSPKGARGLMQIIPVALKDFNQHTGNSYSMDDMFDSGKNVQVGSWYKQQRIPQMLRQYGLPVTDFNVEAAYNGGIGRVVDYHKRGRALPEETRNYVMKQAGGAVDPISLAIQEGLKLVGEGINSYQQTRNQSKQLVQDGVHYLSDLASETAYELPEEYAQQGWNNPYHQQQSILNTPQQESVIPQFVPTGGGTPQSAAGLKPQPNQDLWQDNPFPQQQSNSGGIGNFLSTPLKLLGNIAGKLIPQINSAPVAAGIATSVFNARNAAQQKKELMEKIAKRNDQSKFVNSNKGLEYRPLYVQHGGKYKYTRI